jgi:hypothetical protein
MNYKRIIEAVIVAIVSIIILGWAYSNPPQVIAPVEAEETWESLLTPELKKLAQCESGMNPTALNAVDSNGKRSVGLLQFQDATFIGWAKQIDPYKKWDIWNPKHQIEVAKWAFIHNYQYHWGCWKMI